MKDRIVLRLQPLEPYQNIYIFANGEVYETLGTTIDNVSNIVLKSLQKYNLKRVEFVGAKLFTDRFEQRIRELNMANYHLDDIEYVYIQLYGKKED